MLPPSHSQLPPRWLELREAISREARDVWLSVPAPDSQSCSLEDAADAVATFATHPVDDPTVDGLAAPLFAALEECLLGESSRGARINAFKKLSELFEPYLKKLAIVLIPTKLQPESQRPSAPTTKKARPPTLGDALLRLNLLTSEELTGNLESLRQADRYRYSLGRAYVIRNTVHEAPNWTDKAIAENLEHLLVAYLHAASSWFGEYRRLYPRSARLLSPLIDHAQYVQGLTGFLRYLLPESLPFVSPHESDPAHPARIFKRLQARAGQGGLLLVGPGGVGKSRTSLEVATRAARDGYHVFHALPGEPSVTVADLDRLLLAGRVNKVLLVIDYLEHMIGLELATVRYRLLPEARARGVELCFLACARPAWLLRTNVERDALFERVDVRPDSDRAKRISGDIRRIVAPKALDSLGEERIGALTGERPIVVLLMSRELERRAHDDQLLRIERDAVPDLAAWLHRRLMEDGLIGSPPPQARVTGGFTEAVQAAVSGPEAAVIGAATALACVPLRSEEVVDAVRAVLTASNSGPAAAQAVVDHLVQLGWLEERHHHLEVAHDVVADELLESVLWDPVTERARVGVLHALFAGGLREPRTLGRIVTALQRMLGGIAESRARAVETALQSWLASSVSELRGGFLNCGPDAASYAFGAMLSVAALHDELLEHWDTLVRPWLDRNQRHRAARHLLYRGLRAGHGDHLERDAFEWLAVHGLEPGATFVIGPLLDLPEPSKASAKAARAWLARHQGATEAVWLLNPLIGRPDLIPDDELAAALGPWLRRHIPGSQTWGILARLLSRPDIVGDCVRQHALDYIGTHTDPAAGNIFELVINLHPEGLADGVLRAALDWVAKNGEFANVEGVLFALLRRPRVPAEYRRLAARLFVADTTRQQKQGVARGGVAIKALLAAAKRSPDAFDACVGDVIELACAWCAAAQSDPNLSWNLNRVLRNRHTTDMQWLLCARTALEYLQSTKLSDESDWVFNSVLMRVELLAAPERERLAAMLVKWATVEAVSPMVRDRCLGMAIGRLGRAGSANVDVLAQSMTPVLPSELQRALGGTSDEARDAIAHIIARPELAPALLGLLGSNQSAIRRRAVRALGLMEAVDAGEPIEALLDDHDSRVRTGAMRALARLRPAGICELAQRVILSGDTAMAQPAALALRDGGGPDEASWAVEHWDVLNGEQRGLLVQLLAQYRPPGAPGVVASMLTTETNPNAIALALRALTSLGDPRRASDARGLTRHANKFVRVAAVRCLGELGDASELDLLIALAADSEATVSMAARYACTRFPDDPRVVGLAETLGADWLLSSRPATAEPRSTTDSPSPARTAATVIEPVPPGTTLSVGTVIRGLVSSITDYALFVRLSPTLTGFLHVSEIPAAVAPLRTRFAIGWEVVARVMLVESKSISLSMTQVAEDIWGDQDLRPRMGERVSCPVIRIRKPALCRIRGCYVPVEDLSSTARIGDVVDVVVEEVDAERRVARARVVVANQAPW